MDLEVNPAVPPPPGAAPPVAAPQVVPPTRRLPFWVLVGTSIYSLGINVVWVSFNNVITPHVVQIAVHNDLTTASLYIGIIEAVGTGIAVIINIISGIISDHFYSKRFGRRAPIMLIGSILAAPFILLGIIFPIALPLIFVAYLGMQFFTNVSSGGFQPTLADFVPEKQRGISAGLKGLFTLIGSILGVLIIDELLAAHQNNAAYTLVAGIFVLTTVINVIVMRPYDKTDAEITPIHLWAALRDIVRFKNVPGGFYWFVFGSFLIYMGLSNFQGFSLIYLEKTFGYNSDQALQAQAIFSGIGILIAMIMAVGGGILSDRIGRRNLIIGAVVAAFILSLLFPLAPQIGMLFPVLSGFGAFVVIASLYSGSIGMVQSVDTALTSDLVPIEEAGKYMGYANLAVGVANAVAPAIFGSLLFLTNNNFAVFFGVTAFFFAVSFFVMTFKVANR
jgi:MFS family permease